MEMRSAKSGFKEVLPEGVCCIPCLDPKHTVDLLRLWNEKRKEEGRKDIISSEEKLHEILTDPTQAMELLRRLNKKRKSEGKEELLLSEEQITGLLLDPEHVMDLLRVWNEKRREEKGEEIVISEEQLRSLLARRTACACQQCGECDCHQH